MSILKNLFGSKDKVLYRSQSPISGIIEVREKDGVRRLFVENILQSVSNNADNFYKRYWTGMVDLAKKSIKPPERVLLLGLGAGSVIGVLRQNYGEVAVDAVEIDPEIIKIARDFFNLSDYKNLNVIKGDAYDVLSDPSAYRLPLSAYGIIIVDAYIGGNFPSKLKSDEFISKGKNLVAEDGAIIFNRFYEPNFVNDIKGFKDDLRRHFYFLDSKVIKAGISTSNILILVKNPR